MNWIINKTKKMDFHTDLRAILKPLTEYIKDYNWIITDLDFNDAHLVNLAVNFDEDYFLLNGVDFVNLINRDIQIIGV